MKCSKCGAQIRSGHLYCDKCGHEVQLVPDYNPLGNMMSNQKKKEEKRKRILEAERRKREKKAKKRKKVIIVTCIFIVVCIIIVIARRYYKENQNYNSFDYQMQHATSSYENSNYESAMQYVDRALTINSQDVDANLLMAKVQESTGNISAAISIINSVIRANPDSQKAYEQILMLYESRQMTNEIKALMDAATSDTIRQTFSSYITPDPEVNILSGTYNYRPEIVISFAEGCQTYYTLDGTIPTTQSEPYEEPFTLGKGTIHLKIICVNQKGILSNVVSLDYRIVIK